MNYKKNYKSKVAKQSNGFDEKSTEGMTPSNE